MKSYRLIRELVIDVYNSEGAMPSYEKLTTLVREHFPNSKWQKSHYDWYKSQIKTGRLSLTNGLASEDDADQIENEVEESLEARVSIECDLRDYLSRHLTQLEPKLTLHDGGVEYQTDAGRIDILAVDKQQNLVVVEIKAGRAKDSAIGQLLGYMGCLSTRGKKVRGILVASNFDERVVFGSRCLPGIRLIKYTLSFGFGSVT